MSTSNIVFKEFGNVQRSQNESTGKENSNARNGHNANEQNQRGEAEKKLEEALSLFTGEMATGSRMPNGDPRYIDERKDWAFKDVVINPHGKGVPEEIFLEGHFQDRRSEEIYTQMKNMEFENQSQWNLADRLLFPQADQHRPENDMATSQDEAMRLATSSGRTLLPRHVFRVIRQHMKIRHPEYEKDRYAQDRRARELRRESTCTLSSRQAMEYANYTMERNEVCHLVRVAETANRLRILEYADVYRKEWFLHLCRRTWETSGHKVIGTSATRRGIHLLREKCGIESWSLSKLSQMMNPTVPVLFQHRTRQVLSSIVGTVPQANIPFEVSRNTVLVLEGADKLLAGQLSSIMESVQQQGGKLLLVESIDHRNLNKDTPFYDIAEHINRSTPEYTLQFYKDIAGKLVQDVQPVLTRQQNRDLTIDR